MRVVGALGRYYRELVPSGYLIEFDSGVAVIVHWRKMSKIRVDRYAPTDYTEELRRLTPDEKDRYIKA